MWLSRRRGEPTQALPSALPGGDVRARPIDDVAKLRDSPTRPKPPDAPVSQPVNEPAGWDEAVFEAEQARRFQILVESPTMERARLEARRGPTRGDDYNLVHG
jgi:hypothetical protein